MIAKKELFESTPVPEAIWKLALPAVLGQIILVLYNMADTFFVGLTGSDAMLSAVTMVGFATRNYPGDENVSDTGD